MINFTSYGNSRRRSRHPLLIVVALICWCVGAAAQDLSGMTPQQLDRIRQELGATRDSEEFTSPVDRAREAASGRNADARAPAELPARPDEASRLEKEFSDRAGEQIRQFGYDLFDAGAATDGAFSGAIGESYRLGIGDQLVVTLLGQQPRTITTRVDREGRVVLPGMPPLTAMGRTFGEFRTELEARVRATMIGTEVFVSVGAVRQIRVMIAGEVVQPGVHQLTGLSTLLDALYVAGGVSKTGSLRRIQLQRGDGTREVDLYQLLLSGRFRDSEALMEGDRVVVPSIGPTVAVGGEVKRPAIFEVKANEVNRPPIARLIEWAGGPLRAQGYRVVRYSLNTQGQDLVSEPEETESMTVTDGDIVLLQTGAGKKLDSVFLTGHVRSPGLRSLPSAPTLSSLVGNLSHLLENPYLPFTVLSRVDSATGARVLRPIDLTQVFSGEFDERLQADDVIAVLGMEDIRFLISREVQNTIAGVPRQPVAANQQDRVKPGLVENLAMEDRSEQTAASGCRGLDRLASVVSGDRSGRFANAIRGIVGSTEASALRVETCPRIFELMPELLVFVLEHSLAVTGEVRSPGVFPVAPGSTLESLLPYAGGLAREADRTNIELSRFESADPSAARERVVRSRIDLDRGDSVVAVRAGDIIRVNPKFSDRDAGPVLLTGEFIRPGVYDITRGEKLSQVIARAGGLTKQAYPYGAVFTRERMKNEERRNFDRYLRDLQSAIVATQARAREAGAGAVTALESLASMVRETEPVGRIVVEADPTVLQVRPELDIVLEPGDRIHMPKRGNVVTVTGEVLNPSSVGFTAGLSAGDYIQRAGGFTQVADDGRTFVVLPDGSARPLKVSFWNYRSVDVPPGSTIVVPRDPLPYDWLTLTRDLASIFSDLAISAAALDSLNNP